MRSIILVVDDEKKIRLVLKRLLQKKGFEVTEAPDGKAALESAADDPPDLVLLDLKMPKKDGMQTLKDLQEKGFAGKVIMMTAFGTIASAVEAMREGAYDYITKPFSNDEIMLSIERALEHGRLQRDLTYARQQLQDKYSVSGIVAAGRKMLDLLAVVKRIAVTDTPALIVGESGTGKELIAKAIHQESSRRNKQFFAINCSAVPATLIESELFGYRKGAFTGAERSKPGIVAEADGGTLFLDEVAELSPEAQAKLLRFTQSGEFISLGDTKSKKVDVRLLAATNKDLEEEINEGRFRDDLFYRLNVVMLKIPPLRERAEDIPLLVDHFLRLHGSEYGKEGFLFDKDAIQVLITHAWPGNVRELENAIKSALVMAESSPMSADLLPVTTKKPSIKKIKLGSEQTLPDALLEQQESLERNAIQDALKQTGGNRTRAAEILGISRNTLLRKIRQYGISQGSDLRTTE